MRQERETDHVIASLAIIEKIMMKLIGGESCRQKKKRKRQNVPIKRDTPKSKM